MAQPDYKLMHPGFAGAAGPLYRRSVRTVTVHIVEPFVPFACENRIVKAVSLHGEGKERGVPPHRDLALSLIWQKGTHVLSWNTHPS